MPKKLTNWLNKEVERVYKIDCQFIIWNEKKKTEIRERDSCEEREKAKAHLWIINNLLNETNLANNFFKILTTLTILEVNYISNDCHEI